MRIERPDLEALSKDELIDLVMRSQRLLWGLRGQLCNVMQGIESPLTAGIEKIDGLLKRIWFVARVKPNATKGAS